MTTWHPPIPAERLYSSDALDLGPALAMLVWCYDNIERDGRVEIQLNKLAVEFGKSYRTIKDWWAALRDGPFFCEAIDRGKRGWVVRMSEDWIDWHVMANNYPSRPDEGQKTTPESSVKSRSRPNEGQKSSPEGGQGPVKSRSRPDEGQNTALETSAYKEDQHDQKPERHGAMFSAVARACRIDTKLCTNAQRNQVAQTAKALSKAGKLPEDIPKVETWWYIHDWRGKKGEAPRPAQLQEVWEQAMTQQSYTNGRHAQQNNPERIKMAETDLEKGF